MAGHFTKKCFYFMIFDCYKLKLSVSKKGKAILSVAVMSQIGVLTPDWSMAAVPCYSPE